MEERVKKAVQFLTNPKSDFYSAQFTTIEKKYEFLRTKLTPLEFEEAKKRYEESKDFSKYFEPAPMTEQVANNSWNTKILKIIGGVIFGGVSLGYLFSRGNTEETSMTMIKDMIEEKFKQQAEILEVVRKQVADTRFEIENLKKSQDELFESVENLKEIKIVESSELIDKPQDNCAEKITELFNRCFSGISEGNKGVALKTMKMWFSNLISNPYDKTKTRINMTNPHYKNYFSGNEAADELFKFVGFSIGSGFIEFDSEDLSRISIVLDRITEGINSLPTVQFSAAAPWQVARPLEKKKEEVKVEESKITENTEKSSE